MSNACDVPIAVLSLRERVRGDASAWSEEDIIGGFERKFWRCWCWDCFLPDRPDDVNEVGWESSLAGICSMFGLVVGLVAGILVV